MSDYATNEALFTKPEGWVDGSTNVVHFPKSQHLLKFMMMRTPASGKTLDQYVETQTKELAKRTPFFEITSRGERTIAGKRALWMKCGSREPDGEMSHLRAALQVGDEYLLLMFVAKATGEAEVNAAFERAIGSIKFRDANA